MCSTLFAYRAARYLWTLWIPTSIWQFISVVRAPSLSALLTRRAEEYISVRVRYRVCYIRYQFCDNEANNCQRSYIQVKWFLNRARALARTHIILYLVWMTIVIGKSSLLSYCIFLNHRLRYGWWVIIGKGILIIIAI